MRSIPVLARDEITPLSRNQSPPIALPIDVLKGNPNLRYESLEVEERKQMNVVRVMSQVVERVRIRGK